MYVFSRYLPTNHTEFTVSTANTNPSDFAWILLHHEDITPRPNSPGLFDMVSSVMVIGLWAPLTREEGPRIPDG